MSVSQWLKRKFSKATTPTCLYKAGMEKARQHDHEGAIGDYTAAVEMPDVSMDVKAMALYNRALVHAATRNADKAIEDLNLVLAMREAPGNIKAAAKQKLSKILRRAGKDRGSNS